MMENYTVVSVKSIGKKKCKVVLEGIEKVNILSLYSSEIRRYNIIEGGIVTDVTFGEIYDVLRKRGKERALYYLKNSDKTTFQMRSKLHEGYYPDDIIEDVLSFLEKYGYIDDYRYAQNYVNYYWHNKSVRQIKNSLTIKGISRDIVEDVIQDSIQEDGGIEERQIEAFCRKKIKTDTDEKQYNKIIAALVRKGYRYEQVRNISRRVLGEITS